MTIASPEYHRNWYANHREERQAYAREKMRVVRMRAKEQAMTTLKTRPDVANERRVVFLDSLDSICDPDVRNDIMDLIERTAILFMERGNLKEYAAMNQAAEFVGACVWHKATAPRK
jgi:hypothetical protein